MKAKDDDQCIDSQVRDIRKQGYLAALKSVYKEGEMINGKYWHTLCLAKWIQSEIKAVEEEKI
jgi:hypothetical protein